MARYDHVIIGSGINALVCAAMLSQHSRVLVVEREAVPGGTMRTDALAPGFSYDPLALTFVLFQVGPAFPALQAELAREGVSFATTHAPTGVLMANGSSLVLTTDRAQNVAAFDALRQGDGAAYAAEMGEVDQKAELLFGLFNNRLWGATTASLLLRHAWRWGPRGLASFFGDALVTNRRRLGARYQSELVRALLAPWPLHAGFGPEQPFSGKMGEVIPYALEAVGAPIATGGAARVAEALVRIVERRRGTVRLSTDADIVLPGSDGRDVRGLRLADGEEIDTPSVICSVTPSQLYGRLLREFELPEFVPAELNRFEHGRANMQLHYALERPVAWPDPELASVQLLHLSDGIDAVSKACNEAERGMLPERPTICVGQPTAADPSRAPQGKAVLWVQLPECPRKVMGDAGGVIAPPPEGDWSEAVREAYADRVEAMIAQHVPDFRQTVIARRALSPADIEAMNVNLSGGDPYGGRCGIDQFFLFRPFPQQVNHKTAVPDVYHIGASTHPGPGLSGASGYLLARSLR